MNLQLIQRSWEHPGRGLPRVALTVPRLTLMKRRWQMEATDGTRFGFDLEKPLQNGDVIFETDSAQYTIAQEPEAVLEIPWSSADEAARLGWLLGNLHFPVEMGPGAFLVADDSAVRQLLERNHVPYSSALKVFQPLVAHSHSHVHDHVH